MAPSGTGHGRPRTDREPETPFPGFDFSTYITYNGLPEWPGRARRCGPALFLTRRPGVPPG